jgi:type VI secretion system VgrG family protein
MRGAGGIVGKLGANELNRLSFAVYWETAEQEKTEFEVISFDGREALSEHYEFKLQLRSKVMLRETDLLGQRGVFTIQMGKTDGHGSQSSKYNGIIFEFSNLGQMYADDYNYYQITLAPKLAYLKYQISSDVFIESSLPKILNSVFNANWFNNIDRELAFNIEDKKYQSSSGIYNRYSYVCQYEESEYNFINRLLERDGLYYYFAQDNQEKMVITDSIQNHLRRDEGSLHFCPRSHQTTSLDPNALYDIRSDSKLVTKQVMLKNFGYEKAHLGDRGVISCNAYIGGMSADQENKAMFGETVIYGENFINPQVQEDGDFLANIRAQEVFCRRTVYTAKSTAIPIYAGMKINIEASNNKAFHGEYLVVEVIHQGFQQLSGIDRDDRPFYENTLVLIPSDVQFRPQRKTPWPKIHGTMNALIDGEDSGNTNPQLDEKGRYKVRLPFIKNPKEAGKGSIWLRLSTPYAGNSFGFHFPLHKGTEVILSFRNGDPDLPVIIGAVFNSAHANVVVNENAYLGGVIKTKAKNVFVMDDTINAHAIGWATNNNWQYLQ